MVQRNQEKALIWRWFSPTSGLSGRCVTTRFFRVCTLVVGLLCFAVFTTSLSSGRNIDVWFSFGVVFPPFIFLDYCFYLASR